MIGAHLVLTVQPNSVMASIHDREPMILRTPVDVDRWLNPASNRTRSEYVARYKELIDRYNDGSSTIDELFAKLLALCRDLDAEEQRHVREHLSEDELVIFDLLTRPDPALTGDERDAVKRVVRLLRERLQTLLAPGWRERVTARAAVKQAVDGLLDTELPRVYTPEIFAAKTSMVFQHLIDQAGAPRSVG